MMNDEYLETLPAIKSVFLEASQLKLKDKVIMLLTIENSSKHLGDWHHPATLPSVYPKKYMPKLNDGDTENEGDVDILLADPELTEPPMYAVVMYNDDYTPMDFVVYILQSEFRHNMDKAVEIMLSIHHKGRGIAGIYPKEIAETKAQKTNSFARKEGYPLLTQIEPHKE